MLPPTRRCLLAFSLIATIQAASAQSAPLSATAPEPMPVDVAPQPRPTLPKPVEPDLTLTAPFLAGKPEDRPVYEHPLHRFLRTGVIYDHVGKKITTEINLDWSNDRSGGGRPMLETRLSW